MNGSEFALNMGESEKQCEGVRWCLSRDLRPALAFLWLSWQKDFFFQERGQIILLWKTLESLSTTSPGQATFCISHTIGKKILFSLFFVLFFAYSGLCLIVYELLEGRGNVLWPPPNPPQHGRGTNVRAILAHWAWNPMWTQIPLLHGSYMTTGKFLNLPMAIFSFVNEMMVMISAASQE